MKERALKVGDFVKIRKWDDMKKQYGLDEDGDIDTIPCFTSNMREYCKNVGKIERVDGDGHCKLSFKGVMSPYEFSEMMFEKQGKFRVGDKVVCKIPTLKKFDGEVVETFSGHKNTSILCRFPGFDGHGGNGLTVSGKNYHTRDHWYVTEGEIEFSQKKKENPCIVVWRKDREVIALDKVTGKRGIAKCNPSDKFDFYTGAKLAIDRMMAPEEKEYKAGDIFQIKPSIVNIDTTKDTLINHDMKKYAGELVEVRGITKMGNFNVKENGYIWGERHLNPIKKVKRRALPGEFVLVTDAGGSACGGDYKNGDIIKITGVTRLGLDSYTEFSKSRRPRCLYKNEYVVLEGYEDCDKVKKFDEPLYNGKVVCIDNEYNTSLYTVGKIYQFHDGVIVTDDGSGLKGKNKGFRSFEEFKKLTGSKFIEVVE